MLKRRRRQLCFRVGYEPKSVLKEAAPQGSRCAMSEGATSELTPESGGPRAIEDAGPADGIVARPAGPPVVIGPENWNPFWSESVRDEAVSRAIRPADLPPQEAPDLLPTEGQGISPPRDGGIEGGWWLGLASWSLVWAFSVAYECDGRWFSKGQVAVGVHV